MTGLNQKTTLSIETITTQTDAIIAKLDSLLDVLIESRDFNSTISDKLTSILDVAGETRDRMTDLLGVDVEIRGLLTDLNTLTQSSIDEISGFRGDYGIIATDDNTVLHQMKQLMDDTQLPMLENIFNATNLTADNLLALSCICDATNPALLPVSDGAVDDAGVLCQRAQAFMDLYITAVMDVKETLEQTGRVTTAIAGVLLGMTLIPGVDFASIPGTAITAVVAALSAATAFKIVQFLDYLQDNRAALTNALAAHSNASGGQAAWYAVVDATLNPVTQLDIMVLAKLSVWTGIANMIYDVSIDIGADSYDPTGCGMPEWTIAPVEYARGISPDSGLDLDGAWSYNGLQGTFVEFPIGIGSAIPPSNAERAYALVSSLPVSGSVYADYDKIRAYFDYTSDRLRFRVDPEAGSPTNVTLLDSGGTALEGAQVTIDGDWLEPVDSPVTTYVAVFLNASDSVENYSVQIQRWNGSGWGEV